ncbi:LmeA family phospholipid-binding protein [Actinokineospora sp. NPDC004072]
MTTMTNPAPRATPKRRRSKALRRTAVTLVVLGGLLVAADFGAAAIVEHEVSKQAQQQFNLRDHPAVKIGGFSFLLQAFSGEYESVTVDAQGVPVNTLRDVEVHAELRGVQAPLSDVIGGTLDGVPVREVRGQLRVKATDVNRAIQANAQPVLASITNLTIAPAAEELVEDPDAEVTASEAEIADRAGKTAGVKLCGTVDVAGQGTELCVFSLIALNNGGIAVQPKRLELKNKISSAELPVAIQRKVLPLFAVELDPGELPFAVTPTEVKVEAGVLAVQGTAKDIVLGQQ